MNYKEAVKVEPKLNFLEKELRAEKDDKTKNWYCANRVWYPNYKPTVVKLVGWYSENLKLKDEKTYENVYEYLYNLLPDCRNCACM